MEGLAVKNPFLRDLDKLELQPKWNGYTENPLLSSSILNTNQGFLRSNAEELLKSPIDTSCKYVNIAAAYNNKKRRLAKHTTSLDVGRSVGTGMGNELFHAQTDVTVPATVSSKKDRHSENDIQLPDYTTLFDCQYTEVNPCEVAKTDNSEEKLIQEKVLNAKKVLVEAVLSALVEPSDWKQPTTDKCQSLLSTIDDIVPHDPEFILKVAVYARVELHLRNPTNFLFAAAARLQACLPFLTKYVHHCIGLPTDWLTIVEFYKVLSEEEKLSLPKALRKALVEKFPDFSVYQLGKYKKDSASKKKEKKPKDKNKSRLTLKFLVRHLHISEPVENVMCLLGKKYPSTVEEFQASRLPGIFDPSRAGKRMKLPVPITWETQLSSEGNTAAVWEKLIGEKNLPYMATLKNLRNLLCAGISEEHHQLVIKYLSSEKAVVNSKQLPQQFIAASRALDILAKDPASFEIPKMTKTKPTKEQRQEHRIFQAKCIRQLRGLEKFHSFSNHSLILAQYKAALETALKISCRHNIPPIPGSTVIVIDAEHDEGLRRMQFMTAMMCYMACEKKSLYFLIDINRYRPITLVSSTFLEGVQELNDIHNKEDIFSHKSINLDMPELLKRNKADHVVLITAYPADFGNPPLEVARTVLYEYRTHENPMLLYCNIVLKVPEYRKYSFDVIRRNSDALNLYVQGQSEQVFKLIAEKGNQHQITHVDTVDKRLGLRSLPPKLVTCPTQHQQQDVAIPSAVRWRILRVFVSSTFKDLHGERDLLARFVFPEIQSRAYRHRLSIMDVDLRWGVTEEESRSNKLLELCLNQVSKCQIFIGILGERYGWVPDSYRVSEASDLEWLEEYPDGASVTELEFYAGALAHADQMKDRAFFYFRDPRFYSQLSDDIKADFVTTDPRHRERLACLKARIKEAGFEVFDEYPATYGGWIQGKPVAVGLEEFGKRVLENLWQAVQQYCKEETEEEVDEFKDHVIYAEAVAHECIDLKAHDTNCEELEHDGLIAVTGKPGSGKTSFLARLYSRLSASKLITVPWFGGIAGTLSCSPQGHVTNFLTSLLESIPTYSKFEDLLKDVAAASKVDIGILVDDLEAVGEDNAIDFLNTIPRKLPSGVRVVITCREDSFIASALLGRKDVTYIELEKLDLVDRKRLIKHRLASHGQKLDESLYNDQLREALNKLDSGNPRYLQVLCNELRSLGVFEQVSNKLKDFRGTLSSLLQDVLERIEDELGQQMVSKALLLLLTSKEGLYEDELRGSLAVALAEPLTLEETSSLYEKCPKIPATSFVRLVHSLKPFTRLTSTENYFVLEKGPVSEAVLKRYGTHLRRSTDYHRILACYFSHVCEKAKDVHVARALQWLPYHLSHAGEFAALSKHVCQLSFVEAKFRANLGSSLIEDLQAHDTPASSIKDAFLSSKLVVNYYRFVQNNFSSLSRYPASTLQQALNENRSSEVYAHALTLSANVSTITFKLKNPSSSGFARLSSFEIDQSATVLECATAGSDIAIGCSSGDILIYHNGNRIWKLSGHGSSISKLAFLPGDRLVSADIGGYISVWNLKSGIRTKTVSAHSKCITDMVVNAQHNFIITTSLDAKAKIWELDGRFVNTLTTSSPINCAALVPGVLEIMTGEWNGEAVVWDLSQVQRIGSTGSISRQTESICDIHVLPNGLTFLTADLDRNLKLWCKATYTLLANWVRNFQVTTMQIEGERLLLQSHTGLTELFSLPSEQEIARITYPELGSAGITAVAMNLVNGNEVLVAVALSTGQVELRNLASSETSYAHFTTPKPIKTVALEGKYLVAATDEEIYIYDLVSKSTAVCNVQRSSFVKCTAVYCNRTLWIAVAYSKFPEITEIFVFCYNGENKIHVHSWEMQQELVELKFHREVNYLLVITQSHLSVFNLLSTWDKLTCTLLQAHALELSFVTCGSWLDLQSVLIGTRGGEIFRFYLEEGSTHLICKDIKSPVAQLAVQDEKFLVVYESGEIVFRTRNGKSLHTMYNLEGGLVTCLMSDASQTPGESKLLVAFGSGTIRIHQLYCMTRIDAFPNCSKLVSLGKKRIVVCDNCNNLSIYEEESSRIRSNVPAHENRITSLGISGNGKRAFSYSQDGSVLLWDLAHDAPPTANRAHCEVNGKWLSFLGEEGDSVIIHEPRYLTRVFLGDRHNSVEKEMLASPKPLRIVQHYQETNTQTKNKSKDKGPGTKHCLAALFVDADEDPLSGFLDHTESSDSDSDDDTVYTQGPKTTEPAVPMPRITLSGRLYGAGSPKTQRLLVGFVTSVASWKNGEGLLIAIHDYRHKWQTRVWVWGKDDCICLLKVEENPTCECNHGLTWGYEYIPKIHIESSQTEFCYVKADGQIWRAQADLVEFGRRNKKGYGSSQPSQVTCLEEVDSDKGLKGRDGTIAVLPVELLRVGDYLVCGLSDGSAYIGMENDYRLFILHASRITGLSILGDNFVSASLDGTLRVWKLPCDLEGSIEQVAVYNHGNPVTAMACVQYENSSTLVMFGDALGAVKFLEV